MQTYDLYRRYRPQTFGEVVGQEAVVKTLTNAIEQDKISHAYIFNGPRGTGKTSIAKIFSKEINEFHDNIVHPDIIEMDAASHNGVDEIRKIIENVNYVPIEAKFKVYIIDEVHMLSKGAFNALLKTLEDPPEYVVFILATTEMHKIPATILSRCQRFDFLRLSEEEIIGQMKKILDQENLTYEDAGLKKVAQLADGSMRDGLTILEKVLTYDSHVSLANVNVSFNLVDESDLNNLLNYIVMGDASSAVNLYHELYLKGIDAKLLVQDLENLVKDKIIIHKQMHYVEILTKLNELSRRLQFSNNAKLVIEVYLIEMAALNLETQVLVKEEVITPVVETPIMELDNKINIQPEVKTNIPNEEVKVNNNPEQPELKVESQIDIKIEEQETMNQQENVEEEQHIAEVEDNNIVEEYQNEEIQNLDDITLMDVLTKASKEAKQVLGRAFVDIRQMLESNHKYGIAKFFEIANINAASNNGCVITLPDNFYEDFKYRLNDINQVLLRSQNKPYKVFLYTSDYWHEHVEEYRNQVKVYRKSNLYGFSKETFPGIEIKRK